MSTTDTQTESNPLIRGLVLLNSCRYSVIELQHFVEQLNDENLPCVGRDDAVASLQMALIQAAELHAKMLELTALLDAAPVVTDELRKQAEAWTARARERGIGLAQEMSTAILDAVCSGLVGARDASTMFTSAAYVPERDDSHAIGNALQLLAGGVRAIVADDKFGKGEMLGRVDMFMTSPATIRDVTLALRGGK